MPDVPHGIEVALVRLEGKVDTLAVKVEAGDRGSGQLVELLKGRVENLSRSIEELKDSMSTSIELAQSAASAVRVDLERQLKGHAEEEQHPHRALRTDVDGLKTFRTQAKVVIGLLVIFGGPAIGAVYQRLLG